ncbi:MAG: hypothetical protein JSR39_03500 [Verrucomicrobia bacterium]|nr:hypothetical protein [Verrucomicrobiota bacterium]
MAASAQLLSPIPAPLYSPQALKRLSFAEISRESSNLGAKISPKTYVKDWLAAMSAGASQRLPFVILGTDAIRGDADAAQNFGTIAIEPASLAQKEVARVFERAYPELNPKERKSLLKAHFREGAIINASNWYVFLNDCFIYGALGANKEFHVGLKSIKHELIWDDKNKRPRALGRELLMLKFSGYTPFKTKQGYTFMPPCGRSEATTPIETYRDAIKEVRSVGDIVEYVNSAVPLRFSDSPPPIEMAIGEDLPSSSEPFLLSSYASSLDQ